MKKAWILSNRLGKGLFALTGLALCFHMPLAAAESLKEAHTLNALVEQAVKPDLPGEPTGQVSYKTYILGPGDQLDIEVLDIPQLSGIFSIGPDGTLFLPRLRALQAEGLTIEELRLYLTEKFRTYVRQPEIFITPVRYRPVRVYVGGEVARPGYYTISGAETAEGSIIPKKTNSVDNGALRGRSLNMLQSNQGIAPTLFDALQAASGVTPFSELSRVQVTRKRASSQGGKVRANINFLRLISDGDEDVNIRLYDGDGIFVQKSDIALREQLLVAAAPIFRLISSKYLLVAESRNQDLNNCLKGLP